jgi:thiamine kinase-like enzyme
MSERIQLHINELRENVESSVDIDFIKKHFELLNNEPNEETQKFSEEFKSLDELLFSKGISIPGISFQRINEKEAVDEAINQEVEKPFISFDYIIKEVFQVIKGDLQSFKGYYLLNCFNNAKSPYKFLLLHDEKSFHQPITTKLRAEDCFVSMTVDEFVQTIEKDESNTNYCCFLLLSNYAYDTQSLDGLLKKFQGLQKYFSRLSYFTICNLEGLTDIKETNDFDALIDDIKTISASFLTNYEITNEEEKILKKLFKDAGPVLGYKVLKGGKSGAKVFEVRPKKIYGDKNTRRYIAKISPRDVDRKLKREITRFYKHIRDFGFGSYEGFDESTFTYDGIRYSYASKDGIKNSSSLAEVITNPDHKFHLQGSEIVDYLFNKNELFTLWQNETLKKITTTSSELYEEYLNKEKIYKVCRNILNINEDDFKKTSFFENCEKVLAYRFDTNEKVCHGDLHSENVFIDDGMDQYLIDFGYTDVKHALIDYVTLECSLKFKHIPFYVELYHLVDFENSLFNAESFLPTWTYVSPRADINYILDSIKKIRQCSLPAILHPAARTEYFIALFCLSFRQISYSDLNQQYAFKASEALAENIVRTYF